MRMLKYFLPFVAVAALSSGIASVVYTPDEYDVHALKQVEKNKSVVNVLNKGNNLFISGDVRAKWMRQQRKHWNGEGVFKELGSGTGKPNNIYLSEVNLLIDYDASCAWAQVKLNFTNNMGVWSSDYYNTGHGSYVSDTQDNTVLVERAFVGYDFIHCGDCDLYAEAGRQKMDYLFESEVMFNSTYDGLLVGFDYSWEEAGDFFIHGGPFVINSTWEHYGWVGEIGAMDIGETGLYAKYAYINWRKKGNSENYAEEAADAIQDSPMYRFDISHFILGYVFNPDWLTIPVRLYGAGLVNMSAKKSEFGKKNAWGWYAGVELGKLEVAGDWSLNVNYQWVQFNACPSFDVSGIGQGYYLNQAPWNDTMADAVPLSAEPVPDTPLHGNTNYKGVEATAFYNVTTNLALRACYKTSTPVNKNIGGTYHFSDFELGVIYSF